MDDIAKTVWLFPCSLVQVVDGDTVDLDIDVGFYLRARVRVRLMGVDAPEKRKATMLSARASELWLRERLQGQDLLVRTYKSDAFGRWLADLFIVGSSVSINRQMIDSGKARRL